MVYFLLGWCAEGRTQNEHTSAEIYSPQNARNSLYVCRSYFQGVHLSPLGFAACQSKKCTNRARSAVKKNLTQMSDFHRFDGCVEITTD